jgi:hypothetical protein
MFEEILETAVGPWGIAAVLLFAIPGSRKTLKTVAKEAVRAGLTISEGVKDLYSEIKEEAGDVVAEVKAERKKEAHEKVAHKA